MFLKLQTDRQTNKQTDRQTNRQTDKQTHLYCNKCLGTPHCGGENNNTISITSIGSNKIIRLGRSDVAGSTTTSTSTR